MKIIILGASGYLGSALRLHLGDRYETIGIDLKWFGNPYPGGVTHGDYRDYTCRKWLKQFDAVILLAGHSSVDMCVKDPQGSWHNNVTNFVNLLSALDDQTFIYASDAGVYGGVGSRWSTEAVRLVTPVNVYDLQKWTLDLLAEQSGKNYFGLRFGMVCGWSPNLRTDVIVNRMTLDGLEHGKITVRNPTAYCPILDISDLCRAIECILEQGGPSGIYNLATRSAPARCIAEDVALALHGIPLEMGEPCPTQNMDISIATEKFCRAFNFHYTGSVVRMVESIVDGLPCEQSDRSETKLYL